MVFIYKIFKFFFFSFGDGQNFSFAISTFASNGIETIIENDLEYQKEEIIKNMMEFFTHPSFEAIKSLVIITEKVRR